MRLLLVIFLFISVSVLAVSPANAQQQWSLPLYAGQHTLVGQLLITTNGGGFTAMFQATTPGWCFGVTHFYADTTPPSSSAPGLFPYKHENLGCVTSDSYTLAGDPSALYFAAHAEAHYVPENVVSQPTVGGVPSGSVMLSVDAPGSASYFDSLVSGVLNGTYRGWCVDLDNLIYSETLYAAQVYSSYDPALPTGVVDKPQDFDLVNYVINQNYVGQGIPAYDVQVAIWTLIDDNLPTGGQAWSQANVNAIVADARANGEGFVPACGQLMAVLLNPDQAGVQRTIIEYTVPCVQEEIEVGSPRSETAWALPQFVTLFGPGWGGYFQLNGQVQAPSSGNRVNLVPPSAKPPAHSSAGGNGNGNSSPPAWGRTEGAPPPHANNPNPPASDTTAPVVEADSITPIIPLADCRAETLYLLNLRAGPGTDFEVLRLVPYRTQVEVLAQQGDWYTVQYRIGVRYYIGWLHGAYLELQGACVP